MTETYIDLIEDHSGIKFHEAQVALSRKWIDGDWFTGQTVEVKIAQETMGGIVPQSKTPPEVHEFSIPETEGRAEEVIRRFEEAARNMRGDGDVSDNDAQHSLEDQSGLLDEKWLGSEEELDA